MASSPPRHALLAVSLLTAALCGCPAGSSSAPPQKRPPPLVAVAKVEARDVPVEVRAPVDLRPLAQAEVGSKVLGYLDAVLVDRGDHVKKGQMVALVRPSDLPDQLTAAKSTLAQAQASRALAQVNADRARQLQPEGLIAQGELERSEAVLAQAKAAEAAARAQIGAVGTRLGEAKIESPLDGVVLARRLDPGALVGPPGGGGILTVARIDVLRVFITVNERDAGGVAVGLDAHVDVDALPGKRFEGKVVRLAPGFDAVTRTLEAEVDLDNASGALRPGMYGRGAIVVSVHPRAAVIPASAMQISDKRRYAFVVAGDKAQRRPIETGVDGGDWLEVTKGLAAGEEVVVAGADALSDGASVRVSREPAAPAAPAAPVGSASVKPANVPASN